MSRQLVRGIRYFIRELLENFWTDFSSITNEPINTIALNKNENYPPPPVYLRPPRLKRFC